MKPEICIITIKQLMSLLKVSRQTITNWKDQGLPIHSRGKFDLMKVFEWYVERTLSEKQAAAQSNYEYEQDKARKMHIEADLKQFEFDQLTGKLIFIEDAIRELSQVMTIVKTTVISIPNKLAPQLVGRPLKEVKLKLQSELNESLRAIDFSKYYEDPKVSDASDKPV